MSQISTSTKVIDWLSTLETVKFANPPSWDFDSENKSVPRLPGRWYLYGAGSSSSEIARYYLDIRPDERMKGKRYGSKEEEVFTASEAKTSKDVRIAWFDHPQDLYRRSITTIDWKVEPTIQDVYEEWLCMQIVNIGPLRHEATASEGTERASKDAQIRKDGMILQVDLKKLFGSVGLQTSWK